MSEMLNYDYFRSPETRAMIAECGFRVAEYLHDEQIASLALVDTAARNLHIPIRAAWKHEYPDEPAPTVYFLNPDGFVSPETHDMDGYIRAVIKEQAVNRGVTSGEQYNASTSSTFGRLRLYSSARARIRNDTLAAMGHLNASAFTASVDTAIRRDNRFNGRVLVLDVCTHTGGSIRGIAETMKNIGIIDVRTGVVSNVSNLGHDVDYVVFDEDEAPLECRPFGVHRGILTSRNQISSVSSAGISESAKKARGELYHMSEELASLRDAYTGANSVSVRLSRLPSGILEVMSAGIISTIEVVETVDGIQISILGDKIAGQETSPHNQEM
jgi:hypothetical protein